ncbi:DDB1- and CUL4-associated factor 8-like [Daktulosphaira vitifoliae]|uniref:DDB1- and CUL4-associated factor 8-like n=1 Tax=Daktulosphaira vitifoliae TaxID=58002 RepID=UPI0021A9D2D7|nr:DDB1- and CUL4-associated factor 8-like [Daktulosphaira vitifoliae]XP_050525886.1 DDB1- and CUL4-associated factor 8-like [Daktulosphaira vitifoliae]XP_050525887.1 DDB1- and CUL4-associated factor 8-like [Daktulosphaira vitifoliae]
MTDSDTDSSDSDHASIFANNNVFPIYSHLFRLSSNDNPILEPEDESDSDNNLDDHSYSSSGNSDASLHNTTDDSNDASDNSSVNISNITFMQEQNHVNINVEVPKPNWCTPKELYNREIGKYKRPTNWYNKFYRSLVAIQKLKLNKQLKGHQGCVNALDFNSSGDTIASGSDDLKVCLWNWSLGKCLLKYNSGHSEHVFQTKFLMSQSDIRIVSSGRDGLVILSAVGKSDVHFNKILASHNRSCNKLSVHKDLPYVVLSCGEDGVVKSIDIRESPINENVNSTNIQHIRRNNGSVVRLYDINTNPMNPFEFIVIGDDKYVRLYDKRKTTHDPVKKFHRILPSSRSYSRPRPRESHITSAVFNYCGTEILASYSEDDIYLFDVNGSPDTYLHQYGGHLNRMTIKGVNFYGPKSDYVISGSDCGHFFIWDKKTEAIVQKKHADANGVVNVLEPHPHMPTLATSGLDKTIKIWQPLNKCQQLNIEKLKMSIIKNRMERERRIRESNHSSFMRIVGRPYTLTSRYL